jgi:signal transduction histidine kinase
LTPEEQWVRQREKVVAYARLAFSIAAILVIQLNPARIARFPLLSHLSLSGFFLYSLLIAYLARRERLNSRTVGLWTTCLDLIWVSLIVFSTGGSRTPFFVYYLFPVITASSRYGVKGGLIVAAIGSSLYGLTRFSGMWADPIPLDTYLIRGIYLIVLAYIFGFISQFEKRQNEKLLALYRTAADAAVEQERRRIASELHDRLLQVLASLALRLEACRDHLMGRPQELARELELMEKATRESMREIRTFLAGNWSADFPAGTLRERLSEDLKFLRDGLGLSVVFESEPEEWSPPPRIEQEVYWVLREALLNVARHAQASSVEILLRATPSHMEGSVTDDGIGFDPAVPAEDGFGLSSMRERVAKLGGTLKFESGRGQGTKIAFRIPLPSEAN